MYSMKEAHCKKTNSREGLHPKEKTKLFSVESLLDLTETIATLTIGAGFLLLVAACLSTLQ